MEFAKVLRIKTSTIVFNVYIDENLTRMRHQLFANVWKHKKSEQWHSAWLNVRLNHYAYMYIFGCFSVRNVLL